MYSWPIVRTRPNGKHRGRSLSVFINNGQCHLTTVDAYSDGAIDAWGFLDFNLFEKKLKSRWVVTRPRTDQSISVHNFGATKTKDAAWDLSDDHIRSGALETIRSLNPEMKNLVDMRWNDTEMRGKVRYAKMGMSDKKLYRPSADGSEEVLGDFVPTLVHRSDHFELTQLFIFSDRQCRIGVAGILLPMEEALSLYDTGKLTNVTRAGARVQIEGLGEFTCVNDFGGAPSEERKKEVRDLLKTLNGEDSCIGVCVSVFRDYEASPSEQGRDALRAAYEAVPKHLRSFCGDMDTKDWKIRRILYPDQFARKDE